MNAYKSTNQGVGNGSGHSDQTATECCGANKKNADSAHTALCSVSSWANSPKDWSLTICAETGDASTPTICEKRRTEKMSCLASARGQNETHKPNASRGIRSVTKTLTSTPSVAPAIAVDVQGSWLRRDVGVSGVRGCAPVAVWPMHGKCASPAICVGTKRGDR